MKYRPLQHGKIVQDLGNKFLVSFTYSPTMYIEDQGSVTIPIKKENARVNAYGVVEVKESVYPAIMDYCGDSKIWDK